MLAPATSDEIVADESPEEAIAEEAVDEVETQGAAPLKTALAPTKPSAADVEEHNVTHIPYRSWCGSCVEGRVLGEQRGRHAGRVHDPPGSG